MHRPDLSTALENLRNARINLATAKKGRWDPLHDLVMAQLESAETALTGVQRPRQRLLGDSA